MKEKLKQIKHRKDFIKWLNARMMSIVVEDNFFNDINSKHGINSIFEEPSNDGLLKKYILLTVTNPPSHNLFTKLKNSDITPIHRIRHYRVNGFTKTYSY